MSLDDIHRIFFGFHTVCSDYGEDDANDGVLEVRDLVLMRNEGEANCVSCVSASQLCFRLSAGRNRLLLVSRWAIFYVASLVLRWDDGS